jgi:ParB-like chromosome segregation protein Spo0J
MLVPFVMLRQSRSIWAAYKFVDCNMIKKGYSRTMQSQIQSIVIDSLVPHPIRIIRMSKKKFAKLVCNIEKTGRYEPLVVRLYPDKTGIFQIINGFHRWKALQQLGYETVDVIVWEIDDNDTDILIATLNRLGGTDVLEKKLALMDRLNQRKPSSDLAKRLPYTARQIHRLAHMNSGCVPRIKPAKPTFAHPFVFFLSDAQKEIVEKALSNIREPQTEKTRAGKNAAALTYIAQQFNVKS